jgi:hypothetical protein
MRMLRAFAFVSVMALGHAPRATAAPPPAPADSLVRWQFDTGG